MKNSDDTIGKRIRLVAQCLNQLRHRMPRSDEVNNELDLTWKETVVA